MVDHPESVAQRVVRSVATYTDTDPLELPPLYHAIDSDALNAFFSTGIGTTIQFQYAECVVNIHENGTIDVSDEPVRADEGATRPP